MTCVKQTRALIVAAAIVLTAISAAWAQQPAKSGVSAAPAYPDKPIRLISPFAPGGGATIVAHLIGQQLTERWGQSVVIDNRGGAGGAIGTGIAARATPDGYTLVMATASSVVINPLLSKVPFDPATDFLPVVRTTTVPLILVVHPSVPAKSVKELIAYARSQPGKLNFASSGDGTISQLAGELFKSMTGADMVHIPFRGGGPALNALLGGQVQINFSNILEALPQVRAGRLRGLGVTSPTRSPAIPDMPTIAEAGLPGYQVVQWSGVLAPADVPKTIVQKLNREIDRILSQPRLRERLRNGGAEPAGGTAEEFAAFIKADIAKWARVIKEANIRIKR